MRPIQKEIIDKQRVMPIIDAQQEVTKSIQFLKDYLKKFPFLKAFVLGISGGQDSTLAGRLAQMAIEELREETKDNTYQFVAVRLPYGNQADEADAKKAIEFIRPDKEIGVNIKQAVEETIVSLEDTGRSITDFNKGNIKARQRMIVQYAVAGEIQGAVIGTDHAAENITGFFTKFGDGGADILPLARLNKRQGRQMLAYLGADEELYTKIPTADLEDDKPLLSDEKALGVSYEDIDDYLEGREIPIQAAETIEKWYKKTEHKRHLPITMFDTFWR